MESQSSRSQFRFDLFSVLIPAYCRNCEAVKTEIAHVVSEVCRCSPKLFAVRKTVEEDFSQTYYIIFHYLLILSVKQVR